MSCCVCMDPIVTQDDVYASHCGHVLHSTCWRECLAISPFCPVCRKATTQQNLIRLFFTNNEEDIIAPFARRIGSLSSKVTTLIDKVKATEEKISAERATNVCLRERLIDQMAKEEMLQIAKQDMQDLKRRHDDIQEQLVDALRSSRTYQQHLENTKKSLACLQQQLEPLEKLEAAFRGAPMKIRSLEEQVKKERADKIEAEQRFQALVKEVDNSNGRKSQLREIVGVCEQLVDNYITLKRKAAVYPTKSNLAIHDVQKLLGDNLKTLAERLRPCGLPQGVREDTRKAPHISPLHTPIFSRVL